MHPSSSRRHGGSRIAWIGYSRTTVHGMSGACKPPIASPCSPKGSRTLFDTLPNPHCSSHPRSRVDSHAGTARFVFLMATTRTAAANENEGEIFRIALECKRLFLRYAGPEARTSETQEKVASLLKRFNAWSSNIGVFAAPSASLDKTLQYSNEIRSFVTQLLSLLRRNLEFGMSPNGI